MNSSNWLTDAELEALGLGSLGMGVSIDRSVLIVGANNVTVGSHSRIDSGVKILASTGKVDIGKHVHVASDSVIQGAGNVSLGDFSGLSYGVRVLSSSDDFLFGNLTNPTVPDELRRVLASPIIIEKHGIVGANSVILPGVKIGIGGAIGALTHVSRSVLPGEIVQGSVKNRIGFRNLDKLKKLESDFRSSCTCMLDWGDAKDSMDINL